jgi:hypothetical protein
MVRYALRRNITDVYPRENWFAQRTISRDTVLHAPYELVSGFAQHCHSLSQCARG